MIAKTVIAILIAVFAAGVIIGYAMHRPGVIACQATVSNGQTYYNNCVKGN